MSIRVPFLSLSFAVILSLLALFSHNNSSLARCITDHESSNDMRTHTVMCSLEKDEKRHTVYS